MRIWSLLLFTACTTNHTIQVDSLVAETTAWAQGTQVVVSGWVFGEGSEREATIDSLDLRPDGLASAVRIDDHHFAIRTVAPGTLHVHFTVDGGDGERPFEIVPATVGPMHVGPAGASEVDLEALPPALTPRPAELGVFAPGHVVVEEPIVDAQGQILAGDPIQPWAPLDRLKPIDAAPRTRYDLAPDATPVAVSVGGETISFVAVPPGSTARIALVDKDNGTIYDGTTPIPAPIVDVWYYGTQLATVAYDANDRLLVGQVPTVTATSTSIAVVTVALSVVVYGRQSGSSSITVTYDGLTTTFPVATP
ncbi:MAG: hypothetical protein ABI678_01340 [Kofleriaceae bacterium]